MQQYRTGNRLANRYLGAWSPTDLSGCVLWLRSDLGITKNENNRVSDWADQSGNGLNFHRDPPENLQYLWIASDPSYNNKPVVSNDGPAHLSLSTGQLAVGDASVIGVLEFLDDQYILYSVGPKYGYVLFESGDIWWKDGREVIEEEDPGEWTVSYNPVTITGPGIFTMIQNSSTENVKMYFNDTLIFNQTVTDADFGIGWDSIFHIGGTPSKCPELVIYDNVLSVEDIATIKTYLNTKYQLY